MTSKEMYKNQRRHVRYWKRSCDWWVKSVFDSADLGIEIEPAETSLPKAQENYQRAFGSLMAMHSNPTVNGIFDAFTSDEYRLVS